MSRNEPSDVSSLHARLVWFGLVGRCDSGGRRSRCWSPGEGHGDDWAILCLVITTMTQLHWFADRANNENGLLSAPVITRPLMTVAPPSRMSSRPTYPFDRAGQFVAHSEAGPNLRSEDDRPAPRREARRDRRRSCQTAAALGDDRAASRGIVDRALAQPPLPAGQGPRPCAPNDAGTPSGSVAARMASAFRAALPEPHRQSGWRWRAISA